jgi:hypothetical protein
LYWQRVRYSHVLADSYTDLIDRYKPVQVELVSESQEVKSHRTTRLSESWFMGLNQFVVSL